MSTIGQRIKMCREAKQMTLEELSKYAQVTRQTLSRYETGVITNIPSDNIERIARALGTTPAYLMGWQSSPTKVDIMEELGYPPVDHPRSPIDTYDDEILAELQRLHDDPDLRMLLSASHKLSKKDLQFMIDLARRMHSEE